MSILLTLFILFICYLIIDFYYKNFSNKSKTFKGPFSIPIIGNLLHIKDDSHLVFQNDSKIYKEGFVRYWFCDTMTLVIFDPTLMREIYLKNNEKINTRVKHPSNSIIGNRFRGIVTADENYWSFHRDILSKSFTGRKIKTLSSSIEKETNTLINYMKFISKSNQPFITRTNFMNFNSNIVFDYVFSRHIENIYEDLNEEQSKILIEIRKLFDFLKETEIVNYVSATQPFYYAYLSLFGHPADNLKNILLKYYKEHLETIDLNNARDVLDSIIIEYRNANLNNNNGQDKKKLEQLEQESIIPIAHELILAGVETNSTTMEWFMLEMCNHQNYQEKLYKELLDAAASNKNGGLITLSNRPSTPLFNATLKEILRIHPPIPFGVPRQSTESFEILDGKFTIPKNTQIIQSFYTMFRDQDYWGTDADQFKPERFLNDSHSNNYYPYGVGVRNCIGMGFSQDELYLSITNILLNFKVESSDNSPKIDDTPVFGFSFKPIEFKIKLNLRK